MYQLLKCWWGAPRSLHVCCFIKQNMSWSPILTHTLSTAMAERWPQQTRIHTLQHNRHSSHWRNLRSPPRGMTPHRKHPAVTAAHKELTGLLENLYDCKSISHLCLQTWSCCVASKSRTVKHQPTHMPSPSLLPSPSPSFLHPLLLLTFSAPPSLLLNLFITFLSPISFVSFLSYFLFISPPVFLFVSLSLTLSLCVSAVLGVLADPGLPVRVGVWFNKNLETDFCYYGYFSFWTMRSQCNVFSWVTDENVSRLKVSTKSRNRNLTWAFFKLLLVSFFYIFHNMMVSVAKQAKFEAALQQK